MGNEKELNQFRALDFDADDILFSSLVRYHFEREAIEDLEKLKAGKFDAMPEETDCARKRAEKYYRRGQRLRILRHGYHVMQKVSVFLIVLIAGFTYLTISVDAVNRTVVNWLTDVYQTHTHLSIELDDSNVDFSNVKINWIPEQTTLDSTLSAEGYYSILYNNQAIGSIALYDDNTNTSVNTENATVTYLNLPKFDKTMLVERDNGVILTATNKQILIQIAIITNLGYKITSGEAIQILQNIDY